MTDLGITGSGLRQDTPYEIRAYAPLLACWAGRLNVP
jgi:hypothetical protein